MPVTSIKEKPCRNWQGSLIWRCEKLLVSRLEILIHVVADDVKFAPEAVAVGRYRKRRCTCLRDFLPVIARRYYR